jgi:hypothetical protein
VPATLEREWGPEGSPAVEVGCGAGRSAVGTPPAGVNGLTSGGSGTGEPPETGRRAVRESGGPLGWLVILWPKRHLRAARVSSVPTTTSHPRVSPARSQRSKFLDAKRKTCRAVVCASLLRILQVHFSEPRN